MAGQDAEKLLKHLVAVTTNIARGDYDKANAVFELTKSDRYPRHIIELAESFGMMLVKIEAREFQLENTIAELKKRKIELEKSLRKVEILESVKTHLGCFVPESVRRIIDAAPENPDFGKQKRDVSIIFLDVAGYTRLSESFAAEKMNLFLEMYFSSFLDEIHGNNGEINETAGDGLMIIFQEKDKHKHACNAVKTAIAIQQKVQSINRDLDGLFQPFVVNVGINSGNALVGSTRFEGVSGTRLTYTASGPATNVAARIGQLAGNGQILVGEATYQRVKTDFYMQDLGAQKLKNVRKPIRVFEVSAPD